MVDHGEHVCKYFQSQITNLKPEVSLIVTVYETHSPWLEVPEHIIHFSFD